MSRVLDRFIKYLDTVDSVQFKKDLISSGIEFLDEKFVICGNYDEPNNLSSDVEVNPSNGGLCLSEYLTYSCVGEAA